jgi:uncharacterized protein
MDRETFRFPPITEISDGDGGFNARRTRNAIRFGGLLLAVVALLVLLFSAVVPYTNFLWYVHDAGHPEVFTVAYAARGMLFLILFLPTWALLYFSLRQAFRQSLVFLRSPDSMGLAMATQLVKWVHDRGASIVWFGSPVIAFLMALGGSNAWNQFLLARHAQAFGQNDPVFGRDLGFYVFTLPWYQAIAGYAFSALFITTLLTVGVYVGMQALAMLARIELSRPYVRVHLSILAAATLVVMSVRMVLGTLDIGLTPGGQFTGAGMAEMHRMYAMWAFAAVVALFALALPFAARKDREWRFATRGGIAAAAVFVLGVLAYPAIVQRLFVDPNLLARQGPYAQMSLSMTRFAYGLDQIDVRPSQVRETPTPDEVEAAASTLENMRLWDPEVLRQSMERRQGVRDYYAFYDVDIDRYPIGGDRTMVMLSPRDMNHAGLGATGLNWVNQRLRYTHGYGVVMAQVNRTTADGRPVFVARNIPQESPPELAIEEPRIYFGDARDPRGNPRDEYAIVRTNVDEFDYQVGNETQSHRWTGERGIPIGRPLPRVAFSLGFGDGNLLISPNVQNDSRLLMRRNVRTRASSVLPFLTFDNDPYIVLYNGRLIWILDGYTTTERIPYAQMMAGPGGRFNYIRNSVKVTVDAYTGELNAYAIQPDEPLLRAYRGIYPRLVQDLDQLPPGLENHFRYPEDLLTAQSLQLQRYHVTDPTIFLSNGDVWEIPRERSRTGVGGPIRPYYVLMQLPGEAETGFMQILPFTPIGKPNMSGWLAAHCDPDRYGQLTLYRFPEGAPLAGPEQMEAQFNATPEIADINRQFNNEQSEIILGNLLVVPVGDSVMYVEPMFLRSRTAGIQAEPQLVKVILALNNRIVVADTYQDALRRLFEGAPVTTAAPPPRGADPDATTPTPPTAPPQVPQQIRELRQLFDASEAAQRAGDWARYGELQRQMREKLAELEGLAGR